VAETVGAQGVETKTRVFISYSRKDMAFADRLEAALKARGFDVLNRSARTLRLRGLVEAYRGADWSR